MKEKKWGDYIYSLYNDIQAYRRPILSVWWTNLAWLYGNQWTCWNEALQKLDNYITVIKDKRIRLTINIIRNIMAARTAFIVGGEPQIYAEPKGDETEDKLKAYITQRVARSDWEENNLFYKIMAAWEWVKSCGEGYTLTYYDKFEKRIKQRTISPFQVAIDPLAQEPNEWRYFIIGNIISSEDFASIYPELNPDDFIKENNELPPTFEEMYYAIKSPNLRNLLDIDDVDNKKRNLFVLEYYEKPSPDNPDGSYRLIVNKKVAKKLPLDIGEIPVVGFYESMQAGMLDHHTPITDIRVLQEELNRTASLDLERMQLPDFISFPRGQGWPKHFGARAIEIGWHTPLSGEPKFINGSSQRFDYLARMKYFEEKAENLAGVSAIATRSDPKYQMSGRMGYIVTEANRSLLDFIATQFRKSEAKLIKLRLKYIKKYYSGEKIASFINEYDVRETLRFKTEDINDNCIIRVVHNDNLSNPIAKANLLVQLAQNPLIIQELVKNKVAFRKFLTTINEEIGNALFVSETDVAVAQDENLAFSKGLPVDLKWYHNDEAHLLEHIRVLNSDWIKTWAESDILRLEEHCRVHEEQKTSKAYKAAYEAFMMQKKIAESQNQQQSMLGSVKKDNVEDVVKDVDRPLEQMTGASFPINPGAPETTPQGEV